MNEAAAASQKSKAPAVRKSKALTTASRAKMRPACRFAHLHAVRPGELAAAIRAVRDGGEGAAPRPATVHGFQNSERAAAFVLDAMRKASATGGGTRSPGSSPEDAAAFILAAAAKARPNRKGA